MTIFLDEERFIEEAIESVRSQTFANWELLLVDDGSTDGSTAIAKRYADQFPDRIRYLEHPGHENRGMGASRQLALTHASGSYLSFLDADDVYLPRKLERQVAVLEGMPHVGLLYGATEYWYSWDGPASGRADHEWRRFGAPAERVIEPPDLLLHFLRDGGTLPCMGSVLVRSSVARAAGGFDERFRGLYEDQAFLAAVGLAARAWIIPECLDRYRQHPESTCHRATPAETKEARAAFLAWLRDRIDQVGVRHDGLKRALHAAEAGLHENDAAPTGQGVAEGPSVMERAWIRPMQLARSLREWLRIPRPRPGLVRFGSLRRVRPISTRFGYERGQPVDRHYIEGFLERNSADIRGRVLEVGDDHYTRQFGGNRVAVADVLHVHAGNPRATLVGDLSDGDALPSETFDCIILTQTLHLIYDVPSAVQTLHRMLRPGGVLLLTVPGITPIDHAEWGDSWYWSFTGNAVRRLLEEQFHPTDVTVHAHGNVLAASSFLFGLSAGELSSGELEFQDPHYPVIVAARATRASDGEGR